MPTPWTTRTRPEFDLLAEDGTKILQETGFTLVIDYLTDWITRVDIALTSWTNRIEP